MYERTSPHVIYNITRTMCDLIYVGCTKRILKIRIAEHIAGITRKGDNVSWGKQNTFWKSVQGLWIPSHFLILRRFPNQQEEGTGNSVSEQEKLIGFSIYIHGSLSAGITGRTFCTSIDIYLVLPYVKKSFYSTIRFRYLCFDLLYTHRASNVSVN